MLDTIRLKTPYFTVSTYLKVYDLSKKRFGYAENGDLEYHFTSGSLQGSYDNRISIQANITEFRSLTLDNGQSVVKKVDCDPYCIIEFSLHKFLRGHNVYNGSNNLHGILKLFYNYLISEFDLMLPCYMTWSIERIDISEAFKIPFIDRFFEYMGNCYFPRRGLSNYKKETLYFSGSTTTVKMYRKDREFLKHDYKIMKKSKFWDKQKINDIIEMSKDLLRVEVEVKKRKFDYDNQSRLVRDFDIKYLMKVYEVEIMKIFRIRTENQTITDMDQVKYVLFNKYSQQQARSIFATYCNLAIHGELNTMDIMSRSTFYRHRSILQELGISWTTTNISITKDTDHYTEMLHFIPLPASKWNIEKIAL